MGHVWIFLCFQDSTQSLSCKNEDFGKSSFDKPLAKQPAFQIHIDEPDGACVKKPLQAVESIKAKPTVEQSPLEISAVARLRQPLATIDIPSAMDVSFGGFKGNDASNCYSDLGFYCLLNIKLFSDSPMDMSVVEGEEKPVNVNEAPEYAAEIHSYLREMEVRN